MIGIYGILDTVSGTILNNILFLERNDTPAIRAFDDIAKNPKTAVGQHPTDHDLVCLGFINDDHQIVGPITQQSCNEITENNGTTAELQLNTILTGKTWQSINETEQRPSMGVPRA